MIVSPGSRARENRKSDWPWRKRAEQKPHAEFSVGRSSIIGAWYRPVIPLPTRQARPGQGRQAGTPARCVCVCVCVCVYVSVCMHVCVRSLITLRLLCRHKRRAASLAFRYFESLRDHLVNLTHPRSVRHLYAGSGPRSRGRYDDRTCDNAPLRRATSRV